MKFRTQYLIQPKFQLIFSALLVFIALLSAILVGIVIWKLIYANNLIFVKYNAHLNPDFLALLAKERKIIVGAWILSFLSISIILVMVGIYLSHKMAGPMFALTREMDKLKKGDLSARLTLRKRDEFKELKAPFNQWVEAMEKMTSQDISRINEITLKLSTVIEDMKAQKSDAQDISKVENLLNILNTLKKDKEAQLSGTPAST